MHILKVSFFAFFFFTISCTNAFDDNLPQKFVLLNCQERKNCGICIMLGDYYCTKSEENDTRYYSENYMNIMNISDFFNKKDAKEHKDVRKNFYVKNYSAVILREEIKQHGFYDEITLAVKYTKKKVGTFVEYFKFYSSPFNDWPEYPFKMCIIHFMTQLLNDALSDQTINQIEDFIQNNIGMVERKSIAPVRGQQIADSLEMATRLTSK